jgi:hypothetical protein
MQESKGVKAVNMRTSAALSFSPIQSNVYDPYLVQDHGIFGGQVNGPG